MRKSRVDAEEHSGWKKIVLGTTLIMMVLALSVDSRAAIVDFNVRIAELQTQFPHEKYWNHVGMEQDNADGYTDSPCTLHKASGVSHVYGTNGCTCNHFACTGHTSATQCMGFANKLGYEVFGDTTWTMHLNSGTAYQEIAVGDIVRIGGSHSVFVTAKAGNIITVGEANYPSNCLISWGRTIDLTKVVITNYERADNYADVLGQVEVVPPSETTPDSEKQETTTEQTTEQTNSGFRKAKDGVHNCYYKDGKLVKKQWFRADGKDYYANEDGLVLQSQWLYKGNTLVYVKADGSVAKKELVDIGKNTYFFKTNGKRSAGWKKYKGKYYYCDKKGIVQKKKWIIKGSKRYYVQKNGVRVQSKTFKISGVTYYFNGSGKMVRNKKITFEGIRYKINSWGKCKKIGYE